VSPVLELLRGGLRTRSRSRIIIFSGKAAQEVKEKGRRRSC